MTLHNKPCSKLIHKLCWTSWSNFFQSRAVFITNWWKNYKVWQFYYNWGKHNYKVAQLRITTKGQEILLNRGACISKRSALLHRGAGITNWGENYYKVGQIVYYKVGQSLLQSGVGIIKWDNFVAKWCNYYRKYQYIFVTGQMETYVYRQIQCGLRTEFWVLLIFGRLSTKQFLLMLVFRRLKFIRLNKV